MTIRRAATGPEVLAEGTGAAALTFQLEIQDGVITRTQLAALGVAPHDLKRMVRRRELVRVAPGVFVDHTGPLTWIQRAWVAVLVCWPAALAGESAWCQPPVIDVLTDRKVAAPRGVRVRISDHAAERTDWMRSPPREVLEHAVLHVASRAADEHRAIGVLTDRVQSGDTSATRLLAALGQRPRTRRGRWLARVLLDIDAGTNSVLEHEYLVRVERPHGLPTAVRQARESGDRRVYRDAAYDAYGLLVELDGRTFHEGAAARDRDLDRDLAAAVVGRRTVRLGWGQVLGRPCRTAAQVAQLLSAGGWTGRPRNCPRCR